MLSLETTEITGPGEASTPFADAPDPVTALITLLTQGAQPATEGGGVVLRDPPSGLVSVIGRPPLAAISEAAAKGPDTGSVLAQVDDADHVERALPQWKRTPARLHWLVDHETLFGPTVPPTDMFGMPLTQERDADEEETRVRADFLQVAQTQELRGAPDELRRELSIAVLRGPVMAVWVAGQPVSFCHAEVQTETLWDVSIETLESFRRRGLAKVAVEHLARYMRDEFGKHPVWGALETNKPSLWMAARLGFRPVDEIVVFERG